MRPWLVVPIVGVIAGGIAALLGARGVELGCAAAAAAAIVQALRSLAGEEPAAIAGAVAGALLGVVGILEHGALAHHGLAVPWLAVGCAAWTFAELAHPTATPYVALAPAIAAALLDPACVALPAIAGARLLRPSREVLEAALRAQLDATPSKLPRGESGQLPLPIKGSASGRVSLPARGESARVAMPRPRPGLPPRYAIAIPIAGAILIVVAIVAGAARSGSFASLGTSWFGPRLADVPAGVALTRLAEALGPIAVVAVLGGLVVLARVHLASLAILACVLGSVFVDLRTGAPGATTLGLAAICAGAAVARLASMIRLRSGQAITAAACGAILLAPPVWTAIQLR